MRGKTMHRRKNIFISAVVLLFIALFCLAGFAQINPDFEVPVPEGSNLLETKEFTMAGRLFKAKLYTASVDSPTILGYYRSFFSQQGFQKTLDKPELKLKNHLLRFKQGDLVITIAVLNKQGITRIAIARYLQTAGQLPPEEVGFSLSELVSLLPREEVAGRDLAFVPRPDNSIRVAFMERGAYTQLLYMSAMSVASAVDFYKKEMDAYGWELKREFTGSEGLDAYEAVKKEAFAPENPILERPGYKQFIKGISLLEFSADFGIAEITILPDTGKTPAGALIKIDYREK